jgi:Phage portal protein, SPP1 Gp6-like
MKQGAVVGLASDHYPVWLAHTNEAKILNHWAKGEHEKPYIPSKATREYRDLADASYTPWGRLVIGAVSQTFLAESHRRASSEQTTKTFDEVWAINGLLSRQGAVYRGALGQNLSYVTTLPAKRPYTGEPTVRIRGVPATQMAAFYDTEGEDDFARFAMWGEEQVVGDERKMAIRIYDDEAIYYLSCEPGGDKMTFISVEPHPAKITPVHRFSPELDLEGLATGQIKPFIPLLRRLDQDVFDRLIVQRFNSWRTRYIAGLAEPNTDAEKRAQAMHLRIEDLLISTDSATKFGTLDPTDMTPYIAAHEADIRDLAATSQTPPHHLLGQMANLSAEALAAAEASLMRKSKEIRLSFSQTWDQVMRTSSFLLADLRGDADFLSEALDYSSSMHWADIESRSLAQVVDALGKAAEMLKVPVEMLWEQLPFWQREDTARAKELIGDAEANALIAQFLNEELGQPEPVGGRPGA